MVMCNAKMKKKRQEETGREEERERDGVYVCMYVCVRVCASIIDVLEVIMRESIIIFSFFQIVDKLHNMHFT
jgi:hypothetical protein